MILAGDVGGTKTRLAIYEVVDGKLHRHQGEKFLSKEFSGLEEAIQSFLEKRQVQISRACFGVPGPVIQGEAKATNLPWKIKLSNLAKALGLERVKLVNDLVATIASVQSMAPQDLLTIYQGKKVPEEDDVKVVLAPGTGLGQAFMKLENGHPVIFASEGGHADFAPTSEIEVELYKYLKSKFDRVSYERVLCGPGLANIYSFLKETKKAMEPPELAGRFENQDPAAVISIAGQAEEFEICVKAIDIFASILGAQAANLVLSLLATGGIYLGGGMPPKMTKKLLDGTLVKSFLNKGRMSYLVEDTSVHIIKDDHAALLGAAYLASLL